ncbi:MAG: hypothetical protein CME64_08415 [Halobacteriovoraceae bacterium]|nr:hypothetical protein [Halobacteriovoraceae bacterium]|tara:strand:+ start:223467 stop:224669 length:1203 start_codon:yes stop_codon:yes gene_type:complete
MKKISICLALITATGAQAQMKLDYSGQFRVRHENYDIYQGRSNKKDFTTMRARLDLDIKLPEGRRFHISPQAVKSFGEYVAEIEDDGSPDFNRTSGDKYDGPLEFYEAYAYIPLGENSLKIGRQALSYGGKIILGNRNWTPSGQAFDAAKFSTKIGAGELDLVYSKVANDDNKIVNDDATLSFLYYKLKMGESQKLDTYIISNNVSNDNVNGAGEENADSTSYGFRYQFKGDVGKFTTENIYQDFSNSENSAYNLNFEYSHNLGNFTPFASYAVATEDYDQLYANRHKYNGYIDIVGRKNLETISAGLKYKFNDKTALKAEYFDFKRVDKDTAAFNQATSKTLTGDLGELNLGQELDIVLAYKPTSMERVQLAYTMFKHGDYFEESETSKFAYLEYLLKF